MNNGMILCAVGNIGDVVKGLEQLAQEEMQRKDVVEILESAIESSVAMVKSFMNEGELDMLKLRSYVYTYLSDYALNPPEELITIILLEAIEEFMCEFSFYLKMQAILSEVE